MSLPSSERVQRIKPSPTLAVTAKAAELRAAGKAVIGLGAGEPDFDTPDHIKQAAVDAVAAGFTKYTAVDGIPDLKAAIIDKFRRDNDLEYTPNQILVSSGAKQTIFNACSAVLNTGDEVIIPAPYWVSYPDIALLCDATPVVVSAGQDQGYKVTAAQLEAAITNRTRMLILNSPCNPTGASYSREELAELGAVLVKHPDIVILTDDMYEHIYWADFPFCSLVTACPDLYDQTLTINGVSKCYAMTGWRIGYAGGPPSLIAAMKKIQGQSTSNPCSISQKAAAAAIAGDQTCVSDMNQAFRERHDFVVEALNKLPGVSCLPGAGTFYAFANMEGAIQARDGIETDNDLATFFLTEAEVAMVPGTAFGAPGHMRLSFATGLDTLKEAMSRLGRALG